MGIVAYVTWLVTLFFWNGPYLRGFYVKGTALQSLWAARPFDLNYCAMLKAEELHRKRRLQYERFRYNHVYSAAKARPKFPTEGTADESGVFGPFTAFTSKPTRRPERKQQRRRGRQLAQRLDTNSRLAETSVETERGRDTTRPLFTATASERDRMPMKPLFQADGRAEKPAPRKVDEDIPVQTEGTENDFDALLRQSLDKAQVAVTPSAHAQRFRKQQTDEMLAAVFDNPEDRAFAKSLTGAGAAAQARMGGTFSERIRRGTLSEETLAERRNATVLPEVPEALPEASKSVHIMPEAGTFEPAPGKFYKAASTPQVIPGRVADKAAEDSKENDVDAG